MNSNNLVSNVSTDSFKVRPRSGLARVLLRVVLLLWSIAAHGSPPPPGVAPVTVPAGGFAIYGDLLANASAANVGAWIVSTNLGTGGGVLDQAGVPLNPATTFH